LPYNEYLDTILWMPDIKGFCAYILFLENGKTYKGYTRDFRNRMLNHFSGRGGATTKRWKPSYILHYEVLQNKKEALDREQFFKRISGIDNIKRRLGKLNTIYPPNKQ
jgi:putative endonuclease